MALLGLALGYVLSAAGFSEWDAMHRMFLLDGAGARLALALGGAIVIAGAAFHTLGRDDELPARRLHRGTIPGGLLFGAGWAITGCCPALALVQLGEGRAPALWTLAGIACGSWVGRRLSHALHIGPCG
jgi:uncharacterized membrane protein YedE/YeeE